MHSVDMAEVMSEHNIPGDAPARESFIFGAFTKWLALIPDEFDDPDMNVRSVRLLLIVVTTDRMA